MFAKALFETLCKRSDSGTLYLSVFPSSSRSLFYISIENNAALSATLQSQLKEILNKGDIYIENVNSFGTPWNVIRLSNEQIDAVAESLGFNEKADVLTKELQAEYKYNPYELKKGFSLDLSQKKTITLDIFKAAYEQQYNNEFFHWPPFKSMNKTLNTPDLTMEQVEKQADNDKNSRTAKVLRQLRSG